MTKANLELPDGTKVMIEGTPEDVAELLERIQGSESSRTKARASRTRRSGSRGVGKPGGKSKLVKPTPKGLTDYIRELIQENYFRTKRGLGDVQAKLEEGGHIYPITSLSPAMLRLVKAKELRRLKEEGAWKYVNT